MISRSHWSVYTSDHGTEATLMTMDGRVLHRSRYEFWKIWPDFPIERDHAMTDFWRRTHLYPNGDILAIHEGLGVLRIDKDSKLIWAIPNRAHHDFEILPNGDIFHTNSVRVLDGRAAHHDPAFERGNVLLYMLGLGVIAVLDLETETIIWAHREDVLYQHDPAILEDGNLLIDLERVQQTEFAKPLPVPQAPRISRDRSRSSGRAASSRMIGPTPPGSHRRNSSHGSNSPGSGTMKRVAGITKNIWKRKIV